MNGSTEVNFFKKMPLPFFRSCIYHSITMVSKKELSSFLLLWEHIRIQDRNSKMNAIHFFMTKKNNLKPGAYTPLSRVDETGGYTKKWNILLKRDYFPFIGDISLKADNILVCHSKRLVSLAFFCSIMYLCFTQHIVVVINTHYCPYTVVAAMLHVNLWDLLLSFPLMLQVQQCTYKADIMVN